jgi:transcriptional regulator with XRE-family HTH domain
MPSPRSGSAPNSEHVHFGHQLRRWRRAAGLTQAELGRRLAYDHSFISRLERGYRWPTRELAHRCDELFNTGGELLNQWRRADRERRGAANPRWAR